MAACEATLVRAQDAVRRDGGTLLQQAIARADIAQAANLTRIAAEVVSHIVEIAVRPGQYLHRPTAGRDPIGKVMRGRNTIRIEREIFNPVAVVIAIEQRPLILGRIHRAGIERPNHNGCARTAVTIGIGRRRHRIRTLCKQRIAVRLRGRRNGLMA